METLNGLRIEQEDRGGTRLFRLSGRADDKELPRLEQSLQDPDGSGGVVVDLDELGYISSWGIGILVERAKSMADRGQSMIFVRPGGRLGKLFDLLQLDRILAMAESPDAAVARARRGAAPDADPAAEGRP
jgi:anti-anti-sigma factor